MTRTLPHPAPSPLRSLPVLARLNLAGLVLALAAVAWLLWPLWRRDPDLSHGFAAPLLFLILVLESRYGGQPRFLHRSSGGSLIAGLALALGAGGVALAGLYGLALGPAHALTCLCASGGVALLVLSAWMALADDTVGVISFGWPAVAAVALWPLSSPLPPGSYTRFSLALQGGVAQTVTGTLGLVGIAAYRNGNVIELAHTSIGVSEACSGVRSLVASVVAALFLSAVVVRRPWARAVLIVLAPVYALLMNFLRSLILALVAQRRGEIGSAWHDGTGFAIIGATTVLLGLTAFALRGGESPVDPTAPALRARPRRQAALALTLGLLAVFLGALFLARPPSRVSPASPAPDLEALFPVAPGNWSVEGDHDLDQYSGILQTSLLARKTYSTRDAAGPLQVTLYVAYWLPRQASTSLVDAHTPDFCWPGIGWVAEPDAEPATHVPLAVDGRALPAAEGRLFSRDGYAMHVWFWHLLAGKPLPPERPYAIGSLLQLAWARGRARDGDQLFVVVSSNRPWDKIASSPVLGDFFGRVAPLGL